MKIAFYDTKPYDKIWFEPLSGEYNHQIKFFEYKLNRETASLANGYKAVCAFVNDTIDSEVIDILHSNGVEIIALRQAGYNNVDFKAAYGKIHIVRVPAYSPYAVAEHAMAMLLTVNRKTHRAYGRTRDNNFNINGLMGVDLHGKTAGIIGTGKIGRVFSEICRGFGMNVLAYDLYPDEKSGIHYVSLDELFAQSDVISLHCPLTPETHYLISSENIGKMKNGVIIVNTSRGALVDTSALIDALKSGKVSAAGLDVYEEEEEYFFEDMSNKIMEDDDLARLLSFPNVLVTSHQGFFTREAIHAIADTTLENLRCYEQDEALVNEICYKCDKGQGCVKKAGKKKCF